METEIPDVLNSKIKKLRIELPHYSFSHSSSGDSPHVFIGRERILEKLKKVVEDSPDEPGVYLVAGNRGVGKTSLVSEIIKETSLQTKSILSENLRYIIFLLFFVVVTQFCRQLFPLCFQRFPPFLQRILCGLYNLPLCFLKSLDSLKIFWYSVVFLILIVPSFITLCRHNGYRLKFNKQQHEFQEKVTFMKWLEKISNRITSAIKELSYLIDPYNPYRKTQYVIKTILIVCYTQIVWVFFKDKDITPIKAFVLYLCFISAFMIWRFTRSKLREYYRKYKKDKKEKASKESIHDIEDKGLICWINNIFKLSTSLILLFPLLSFYLKLLIMCSILFITVLSLVGVWCHRYIEKNFFTAVLGMLFGSILNPIKSYIKNHNRLFLRINFGHKLKTEKDILRLIVRTLSTEYSKYHRSFWRMLPWRVIAFVILFLLAFLFTTSVENQKIYESINIIVEQQKIDEIISNSKDLENIFSNVSRRVNTKVGIKVGIILRSLDQLVLYISKKIEDTPRYLWEGEDKNNKTVNFTIDYLFWLAFFSIYLFSILLFRCNWITHFFTTHRIIIRRLKTLNSDITHSTERENSIDINSGSVGPEISTKTKKSRSVADAREIEKELQDILKDMQRIPVIMCRPNVVIVFDELDKVEPGETDLKKENQETKASLFSIHATRERQTEILKILSNMKYFLSTAYAKFIFIAGREMFDIHLADVSERNNYIGSIFNVVIQVPSFLYDHPTGKKLLPQESNITSLTEEFVCRRLIPNDYHVESYDLKNYRMYLKRERLCEDTRKIENVFRTVEERKVDKIEQGIIKHNNKFGQKLLSFKQFDVIHEKEIIKIITKHNKEIRRKLLGIIQLDDIKENIQKQIITEQDNVIEKICEIMGYDEEIERIISEQNKYLVQKLYRIIVEQNEKNQKIIAVLQQFIIYLAHLSKGAPKKMIQLFESFVEIHIDDRENEKNTLFVHRYHSSRHFLSFNYYKQYTLGIIAYLMTPIFYRLAESNIKELSDKLLVSSLRFVDFLFKFHKQSFSWKHLDMSPEMLEVNHAPELKSVVVDLLNYLAQVHINRSNFSLSEYKFDGLIANEIFAMAKTDEVFSALFSFSLDEMLPLK